MKKKKYIYGIGKILAFKLFNKIGLNSRKKKIKLKSGYKTIFLTLVKDFLKGKELKNKIKKIFEFSEKIRTYKGMRNKYKYPCRGQRTKTNGKTKKKFKLAI
jgi:small subunit ribosomal protein S13